MGEPDDALALALIEKGLADCGAAWSPDLPGWLHRRIERSYAAIASVIDLLNDVSLSPSRKISVTFAKEARHTAGIKIIYSGHSALLAGHSYAQPRNQKRTKKS